MSEKEAVHGINCPNCGGVVPIPEGQVIVSCPYCSQRSFVRGDRGMRRYQVMPTIGRDGALVALQKFLRRSFAIARDAPSKAFLTEAFLAYLPFWVVWGRVMGWTFGQEKVGSGDNSHYEPREVRVVEEMSWNGAACDVGEFGVQRILLTNQTLAPFRPEQLHSTGLVFEPVGSFSDAQSSAESEFSSRVKKKSKLDRVSQSFVRFFRRRFGLVYYPLWILRYTYRGRVFQVAVDAASDKVLYGKAPGNTLYRAAVLVAGMAAGAFISVDVSALLMSMSSDKNSGDIVWAGLAALVFGLGMMYASYRAFRYGEQYEYYAEGTKPAPSKDALDVFSTVKDVTKWMDKLS